MLFSKLFLFPIESERLPKESHNYSCRLPQLEELAIKKNFSSFSLPLLNAFKALQLLKMLALVTL